MRIRLTRMATVGALALALSSVVMVHVHADDLATGGDAFHDIDVEGITYRYHVFTNTGPATFDVHASIDVDVLVVAGGGGGGGSAGSGASGAGGGAGGLILTNLSLSVDAYEVTVGAGGVSTGSNSDVPGSDGVDSVALGLTAIGGGGGGSRNEGNPQGRPGGSGGGGGSRNTNVQGEGLQPGSDDGGYGHDGGDTGFSGSGGDQNASGGGGGAGGAGGDGLDNNYGGAGGLGLDLTAWLAGVELGDEGWFAGGGGGGRAGNMGGTQGSGGKGGGADGGNNSAVNAMPNTGGGGGGAGGSGAPSDGGSGIVVIRYVLGSDFPLIANEPVSNVTTTAATMTGFLSNTGVHAATVGVLYGTEDASDSGVWASTNWWAEGVWDEGDFPSDTITDLQPDLTYYYTFTATNSAGTHVADDPVSFITGAVTIQKDSDPDEEGLVPGAFSVHRPATATHEALTVYYARNAASTAEADVNYEALSGEVTLPAGATSVEIPVVPLLDTETSANTSLRLDLLPGPYALDANTNATMIIYLSLPPLVLADPETGSTNITKDATVDLVEAPVPDGYTHVQLTTDGDAASLGGSWEAVAEMPSTFTFVDPTAETQLTLYAWFTNTSATVELRRTSGSIFYTEEAIALDAWYVAIEGEPEGDGGPDGRNWERAFNTVQEAVDAASPGDTIYIAEGVYEHTAAIDFTKSDITIIGGYSFDSGLPGTPGTAPTVLTRDPDISTRLLTISGATNAVFRNLTVTGGRTPNDDHGGGIYITNSQDLTFEDCLISNNQAGTSGNNTGHGGGVMITGDSKGIVLDRCTLRDNTARFDGWGGGIYLSGVDFPAGTVLVVTNSAILNNTGGSTQGGRGGGIGINRGPSNAEIVIVDTVFGGNGGRSWGGHNHQGSAIGMRYSNCSYLIRNCLFYGNSDYGAPVTGGTIYTQNDNPTVSIENSTFVANGGITIIRAAGTITVRDSILWRNLIGDFSGSNITVEHSNVEEGMVGTGNIAADPRFERGVYLAADSPSRGTGSRTVAAAGLTGYTTHADGTPAVDTDTVDMGYHHHAGINWDVADLYVSAGGSGDESGADADNALPSITVALALAETGTRIHIGAGNYTTAHETFPLEIVELHGIQLLGEDAATTVIDSDGSGTRCLTVERSAGDTRMANLKFTNNGNRVDLDGGGIHVSNAMLELSGCEFSNLWIGVGNNQRRGGAVYGRRCMVTITDCLFHENDIYSHETSNYDTGTVYFRDVHRVLVDRCRFVDNKVRLNRNNVVNGVALSNHADSGHSRGRIDVRNSLFAGNHRDATYPQAPATQGEAVNLYDNNQVSGSIENCTIVGSPHQALRFFDGDGVTVRNNILWDNGADVNGTPDNAIVTHNNFEHGYKDTEDDNISAEPLFEDAGSGHYRLQPASPSVGAGLLLAWMDADARDLDGEPRTQKGLVDMGAYQYPFPPLGSLFLIR